MGSNWLFEWIGPLYDRVLGGLDLAPLRQHIDLPAGRLLDVGGGTGRVARALQGEVEMAVIVDVAWGMVRVARRHPGLLPVQAVAEHLPFADGTFDRVLIVDALHHVIDAARALEEMARVLRPGGLLVIEEPDIRRWPVKGISLVERALGLRSRFLPPQALQARLAALGLAARIHEEPAGLRFWAIGRKPTDASGVPAPLPSPKGQPRCPLRDSNPDTHRLEGGGSFPLS